MRNLTAAALLLALALPGVAGEEPKDADFKTVKAALDRFKREFKTKDLDFKMEAIETLAKVQHPLVAKELIRKLKTKNEYVQSWVAKGLGNQATAKKLAGPKLHGS